jgi:hypothetical protein
MNIRPRGGGEADRPSMSPIGFLKRKEVMSQKLVIQI